MRNKKKYANSQSDKNTTLQIKAKRINNYYARTLVYAKNQVNEINEMLRKINANI